MKRTAIHWVVVSFVKLTRNLVAAFAPTLKKPRPFQRSSGINMLPFDDFGTTFSTAVETFDGSTVDPTVVSGVFWSSLKAKFLFLVIGQFLSAIAFLIISKVAANQLSGLSIFLSEKVFRTENVPNVSNSAQQAVDDPRSRTAVLPPDFSKLLLCIIIDTIGTSSELIPVLGEITDVAWAPIAGLALRSLYSSNVLFALEFTEEILPFTDILPLATICWVVDTFYSESELARVLGLSSGSKN